MKRFIAIVIAAIMLLALIPTVVSADIVWYNATGQVDPNGCYTHKYFPNGGTVIDWNNKVQEMPSNSTLIRVFNDKDRSVECGFFIIQNSGPQPTPKGANTLSDWAQSAVSDAIDKDFVSTSLQTNYTDSITRGEFAMLAMRWVRYTGFDMYSIHPTHTFSDVKNAYYVEQAYALGIVKGITDDTFDPDGLITREQAATMLMRACAAIGQDTSNKPDAGFADASDISDWAIDGVNYCKANNIMQGVDDNNFDPQGTYTREQSIVTFDRIVVDN